jgi:hypothetical protein
MSSHDMTDERFDELARELRSARPAAPAALREHVREIAAPAVPARRRRFRWALAPAAAAAVAGAVAIGVLSSGDRGRDVATAEAVPAMGAETDLAAASKAPVIPAGRAQLYAADITLRVGDISGATQRALRITRSLGGYVRRVDYGEGAGRGTASLVLRVPIARVQAAIVRYSQLGTILDQHVSLRDVQPRLDRRSARMAELRRAIAGGGELAAARRSSGAPSRPAREQRQVSFATVSLDRPRGPAVVVSPPGPSSALPARWTSRGRGRGGCLRSGRQRRSSARSSLVLQRAGRRLGNLLR